MNEVLKLFLTTFCKPAWVANGVLTYECRVGSVFHDMPSYIDSIPGYEDHLPRSEETALRLRIDVSHKGLLVWLETNEILLGEQTFLFVNSTVPEIEKWLMSFRDGPKQLALKLPESKCEVAS